MPVSKGYATRQRAVELYLQNNRTVDDIADELDVARSTVYAWLGTAGVTGRQGDPRTSIAGIPDEVLRKLDDFSDLLSTVLANQESFKSDIRQNTADLNRLAGVVETLVMIQRRPDK